MELTEEERAIQERAIRYVKEHEEELLEKFILDKKPVRIGAFAYFMAGSPGAGKTEFSRRFFNEAQFKEVLEKIKKQDVKYADAKSLFVRIDVDEIREAIPEYRKASVENKIRGNAHVVQKAAGQCLEKLREYCLKNDISFVYDGTFSNYDTMRELVRKSLKLERDIEVYYVYLDPLVAWEFTRAREFLEGRNIVKEKFIEQFFKAEENVEKIKKEFGDKIKVHVILKDESNKVIEVGFNVQSLDDFMQNRYKKGLAKPYTTQELEKKISEVS